MLEKTLTQMKTLKAAEIAAGPSFEVLADGIHIGTFVVAIQGQYEPRYRIGNIATQMDQARGVGITWKDETVVERETAGAAEPATPEKAADSEPLTVAAEEETVVKDLPAVGTVGGPEEE